MISNDENSGFTFTSGERELRTWGVAERISAPATRGEEIDSQLHQSVQAAFARARQAGQTNPIVVGAIPFDPTRASCLFLPKTYAWHQATLNPNESTTQPELLSQA